ncbi:putative cell wall protein [Diplocarpon rosae]|nr:putative cell wall protein [Diplocarpon rosae]
MLSRPQLRFLSLLALVFAVVQASWLEVNINGLGAKEIFGRQEPGTAVAEDTAGGGSAQPTQNAVSESASVAPSTPATPASSSRPANTPTAPASSSASTTASSPETTPSQPASSASATPTQTSTPESSTPSSTGKDTTTQSTSARPTATTAVVVTTIVTTISGSVFSSVASSTITTELPAGTAALNSDGSEKSSGMSTKTRNTIIGVVVGIGGAIILGGLAIVAFRIWGRKRKNDESDGLMEFGEHSRHEKTGSGSVPGGTNPFQSTLENYHNPARNGNVNASANF